MIVIVVMTILIGWIKLNVQLKTAPVTMICMEIMNQLLIVMDFFAAAHVTFGIVVGLYQIDSIRKIVLLE